MTYLSVVLLSLLTCIRSELSLIESDVIIGHRFHERGLFKGEFPCLNATLHGRRKFFEFALTICNDGPHHVRLKEEHRILGASLQDTNGSIIPDTLTNITLPFLRDTVCKGHVFYTRGSKYMLGSDCCCTYSIGIPCMWIDITNITLPEQFLFHLSLPNTTGLTVSLQLSELEADIQNADTVRVNGFVFILAAAALVVVLLPYGKSKLRVRTTPL
jgi:hypothetical protein